jgi:hypothetical protein
VALAMLCLACASSAAEAATISVNPSTGLTRSGQSVTVTGSGFTPFEVVDVYQCRVQQNANGCVYRGSLDTSGSGFIIPGNVTVSYAAPPSFISCEDANCLVNAVGTESSTFSNDVPISFADSTATHSTPSVDYFDPIALGGSVTDTAVVTGNAAHGSPTGNVNFFICGPDGYIVCDPENGGGTPLPSNPRPLTPGPANTASATSGQFTATAPGRYCFRSVYTGSLTYGASYDANQNECFFVKVDSATTSTPSAPWVRADENFSDSAVVTGDAAGGTPTGSVDFFICGPSQSRNTCDQGGSYNGSANLVAGPNNTAHATNSPVSSALPGWFCFRAEHSGDDHYFRSSDSSTSECVLVGGYPRPKAANRMRISIVPAAKACTSPNRTHGPPLVFGSCAPVVSQSPRLTVGVGDGNPAGAKSIGFVRLESIVGPAGPPDESDVDIRFSLTNVMKLVDLSDYAGELRAAFALRPTDGQPLNAGDVPQTTSDISFEFTVPCTPTADTTIGSTCGLATRADTLIPGSVPEGQRSVWGIDQIKVYDGGPDQDADTTGDNSLFEVEGIFIP